MSTAAERRATYAWIAKTLRIYPPDPAMHPPGVYAEILRHIAALEEAGAVVDEPGVEGHVSGDGRAPK